MTVRELIKELQRMPGDTEVVFADSEEQCEAVWLVIEDIEYDDDNDVAILGSYEGWQMKH